MPLEIIPVTSKKNWRDFYRVPFLLHQSDPNWVPPLTVALKSTLSPKNPFFKRARIQAWLAIRHGRPLGRIMGIINDAHNEFHQEHVAFWGFFEAPDDQELSAGLFTVVEQWAQQQGFETLRGPVNPSTNYECGLQISAFDTQPFIMMPQNPAYYAHLIERQGYQKAKDLFAFLIDARTVKFHPRLINKATGFAGNETIVVRPLNLSEFEQEVDKIFINYNDAWEKNWGFIPMAKEEFLYMAKEMKALILPQSCYLVEVDGEVAAFGIWLPDINQVFQRIRDGKLFPTGLLKLLWYTKVKKIMNRGRLLTLGVRKKFRHLPLGALLYTKYYEVVPQAGFPMNECSWILEDNRSMRTALRLMRADHYKTYRIYEKNMKS